MADPLRQRNRKLAMLIATGLLVVGTLGFGVRYPAYKAARDHILVGRYSEAPCVPAERSRSIFPATRSWDGTTLTSQRGTRFRIFGAQTVGRPLEVYYDADGQHAVAANPGDYVYPSEVRFNSDSGRLYVRADGLRPSENRDETWLFEFDADKRRDVEARRINPSRLPPKCADKPAILPAG